MRRALVIAFLTLASIGVGTSSAATSSSSFSLAGTPWQGGGLQCAPQTVSKSPRLRGTFSTDNANQPVAGSPGLVFTLPTDTSPSTYSLESCDLVTAGKQLVIGASTYEGTMVYVPKGWTISNNSPFGVEFEQYHFQNIYGSPISLQLHADHVTLELETGACTNHSTPHPGCAIRSNADNTCNTTATYTCLGGDYAIPPGALVQGAWNEIITHVTWETNNTGDVETYYKVKGATTWTQSSSVTGIPTVQWDVNVGHPIASYSDITEAYTAALSSPVSTEVATPVTGTTFAATASQMP
jgi:hypothetical protein